MRLFVKICGITSAADARLAAEAGADAVGFVFWPGSPRAVDVATAREIVRTLPASLARVGVFVDAQRAALARTAESVGLDLLQLHGHEAPADCLGQPRRVWKALGVGADFAPQQAAAYATSVAGILLDSGRGGSGRTFEWAAARGLRESVPFLILAGGLTPENVGRAVADVRPHGVDVSSGVESAPGRKDAGKLRAFVDAARSAA